MRKYWDAEELELLKSFICAGYTNREISTELGRTVESVHIKRSRLELSTKPYQKYTDEELIDILASTENPKMGMFKGDPLKPCAHTYIYRFGSWNNAMDLANKKKWEQEQWTNEELLSILHNSSRHTIDDFDRDHKEGPCAGTLVRRFGSWSNALELAGKSPNKKGFLDITKDTHLYVIYFKELEHYKVGITQVGIKKRFSGYPEYIIISDITTNLDTALNTEKNWILAVKEYAFRPTNFPTARGGETECFKLPSDKKIVIDFPTLTVV